MFSKLTVRLWLTTCLLLFATIAFAQQYVKGTVTGTDKKPLIGATVTVKGTNTSTATDQDGHFVLKTTDSKATLVITSVGYETKEVPLAGRTDITVALAVLASSLDEIVITGYSSQRRKDLTGAVAVVNVEELTRQPSPSVNNQLQGQASGITVVGSGQPGEEPQVRIRGFNTFGNNTPLYVIDGIPTQSVGDINPNDIASLQVLKDAGSASIYGSRASNGVIIITTRKGSGKVKVQYDGYYGTQRPQSGNVWHILNAQEMANLKWMALANSGVALSDPLYGTGDQPRLPDYIVPGGAMEGDPSVDPSLYNVDPYYSQQDAVNSFYRIARANKQGTDYYHEIFKPAPITSHNLAVSGSSDQGSYFFSLNYFNQEGTLRNTYNKRYTIRSNSVFKVSNKIRVGQNMAFSVTDNPRVAALTEGSAIGMAFRQQPVIPVYDIMGNYASTFSTNNVQLGNAKNPVALLDRIRNNRGLANRLFGNVFAEVNLLRDFTFRSVFGGEVYSVRSHSFAYPEYENSENLTVNSYTETAGRRYVWTWTNTLAYKKQIGDKHSINVVAGYEAYEMQHDTVASTTQGYFSFDPDYTTLSTGSGARSSMSARSEEGLISMFARLDYTFNDKYLLGATIRRDGSSKFLNEQYGWFPAVSLGWRMSEESFMDGILWLDDLKLRGSYGVMGNQLNVTPNNAYTLFNSNNTASYYPITGSNSQISEGFRQASIGNPDARWEKDVNANIGIDAVILDNKIEITADYYRKDIRNLLYNPELPGTAGAVGQPYINVAKIKSNGFDAAINGHFKIASDWQLDFTGTFTTYNTEILKIAEKSYFDRDGRRFNGSTIIRNAVGHSLSEFFGYQITGFWDDQAEIDAANDEARKATGDNSVVYQTDIGIGRFRYADVNGDGIITADDRTFLGNPSPDFSYGLNLSVAYKAFDFSVFLYGTQGNQIWNNVRWWTDFYSSFAGAKSKTALYDSWTPTHKNAKAPIQENSGSFSTNSVPNSYYVENGSYLRARNMMLGYTFPSAMLKPAGISKLRLYVQAANLFTITGYSGPDPEINSSAGENAVADFGIDEGAYPSQRQFLIGLNLTF